MINCIIIEDQPPAQRILKKFIEDVSSLKLVGLFSDGILALEFLKNNPVDLIFLDIHLPKINGLDFLKSLNNPPQVILTTAFSEYALEGYELNVVDYLLKPFSFQRFLQAVNKVSVKKETDAKFSNRESLRETTTEIYVKSGHDHVKIKIDSILYIHSDSDYTEIFTSGQKILSQEPLKYWTTNLDELQFCQVHKSYIVNNKQIVKITGNLIYLENQIKVPIGRAYKELFLSRVLGTK